MQNPKSFKTFLSVQQYRGAERIKKSVLSFDSEGGGDGGTGGVVEKDTEEEDYGCGAGQSHRGHSALLWSH